VAIGYWCEDFEQVSDEEVAELIERSRAAKVGETNDTDT
jgi:predicted phosphoribosyltransferase